MAQPLRPDICIVGAGALGVALAQHARQLGASVVLVDRGAPEPGDSAQSAMRLAILQASAARAQALRDGAEFGLSDSQPKVSFRAIQERMRRLCAQRAVVESDDRLSALGISVLHGEPRFPDAAGILVGETQVRAKAIVLAVGASPQVPAIPGLDDVDTFTVDSILETTRKLSHLLVIGGEPSAFVLAQAFARLGSDVTLVPQGKALDSYDSEAAAILLGLLAEEGVHILDGGNVSQIQPRSQGIGAVVDLPDGVTQALDISHIMVAMGGVPDIGALDPVAARLRMAQSTQHYATGELGETSNRRVRVVGAAAGIDQWQHALRHGRAVVETLVLGAPRSRVIAQPHVILTAPPLAQIGRLPGLHQKARPGTNLVRASLAENEQALASGEEQGFVKIVAGKEGAIVSASIVGAGAAEMAAVLSLAMQRGITLEALADLSLPYPSLLSTISALGDNYLATRPVSAWTARRRALRRIMPFGG